MINKLISFALIIPCLLATSCEKKNKDENVILEFDLCHRTIRDFLNATDSNEEFTLLNGNQAINGDKQLIDLGISDIYNTQVFYDTDENFSHPITYFPDYGNFDLTIPGKTYYYKVYQLEGEDIFRTYSSSYEEIKVLPSSGLVKEGMFSTKNDKVRYCNVKNVPNFRDLGGWETVDGKHVKYGMLYRCSAFDNAHPFTAIQIKDQLGVKTEIDLRYGSPINKNSFGLNYVAAGMKQYDWIFPSHSNYSAYTKTAIQNVFETLSHEENYPAAFHCAVGADRTGTLAFLISGLLGVPLESLTKDFELTTFSTYGYRCRGPLKMPYEYGMYQDENSNYINWGALVDGIKSYNTGNLSLQECFEKFICDQYNISKTKIETMKSLMLEE